MRLGGISLLLRSIVGARALSLLLLNVLLLSTLAPVALAHHTDTSPVRIDALDVSVTVDHHYAVTTVTETLSNPADTAYEFSAAIAAPDMSFVTRFALETGGKVYESRIEESASARAAYDAGAAQGSAGAIVESRDTHNYQVSLNIPARTTVVVHLAYEEMILRTGGKYAYRFPLVATTGGHAVGTLTLGASVTGSDAIATADASYGHLDFPAPTAFTVFHRAAYEVPAFDFGFVWTEAAPSGAGSLTTHLTADGGTFVHVFSPEGAGLGSSPMPKDIVFVIDVSGSMEGSLRQVKEVFASIIADLAPADSFNVVAFSDNAWSWSSTLQFATLDTTTSAREWVTDLDAYSGTNIDAGLALGASYLRADTTRAPIVVFLSDGEPTVGETRSDAIRANLHNRNLADAYVYTLAFGPHADYSLMQALALENKGEVRRIWLDSDAASQIRGFYDAISAPLMRGITVDYGGAPSVFPSAFYGSDLVTVGTLEAGATELTITVSGNGADGPVTFTHTYDLRAAEAGAFVERAAAYERVRSLLGPAALGDATARSEIVATALAYSFVTEYTSLVVVIPSALDTRADAVQQPLLMTTASALTASPPTPASPYTAFPPGRATPGPGALLAGIALAGAAVVALRRRR